MGLNRCVFVLFLFRGWVYEEEGEWGDASAVGNQSVVGPFPPPPFFIFLWSSHPQSLPRLSEHHPHAFLFRTRIGAAICAITTAGNFARAWAAATPSTPDVRVRTIGRQTEVEWLEEFSICEPKRWVATLLGPMD